MDYRSLERGYGDRIGLFRCACLYIYMYIYIYRAVCRGKGVGYHNGEPDGKDKYIYIYIEKQPRRILANEALCPLLYSPA